MQDTEKISIPRNVLPQTDGQQEIELHGSATLVCKVMVHVSIYRQLQNREFPVHIVASKSRLVLI